MLRITDDPDHGCLVLEPNGPLTPRDLEALGQRFDGYTTAAGSAPNLVIHADSFPTWTDLQTLLLHLRFIRTHHRQIARVAIVSDSRALDIAPRIARHIISADIRHFPSRDMPAALAWVASPEPERGQVILIEGLPDDTIGISLEGVIDAKDYVDAIVPLIETKLATHPKINFVYQIGPGFDSFTPAAVRSDAEFGIKHLASFARVALVTDIGWIRDAARALAPLVPAEIQVFADSEIAAAKAWVAA